MTTSRSRTPVPVDPPQARNIRAAPKILLALQVYDERLHRGVLRHATEYGRQVQLVGATSWRHHRALIPDGVISMMAPRSDTKAAILAQSPQGGFFNDEDDGAMSVHVAGLGVPHVDLGLFRPEVNAVRIPPDNLAAGRLAARHLIERGGRHFLHVANSASTQDEERCEGFLAGLREAGMTGSVLYAGTENIRDDVAMLEALKRYPRPLSVFCAFDIWAAFVLSACRLGGLRVPEDVAILGCFNHELISAFESPPLSSVDMNVEMRGYLAARALHRLMRGEIRPGTILRTPVAGVIERASTNRQAGMPAALASALHHIGANLHKPLDIPSIAAAVGASRSVLQKQCRQKFGHGLGEEVMKARMKKACDLLANTTLTGSLIAYELGFPAPFQFYRTFKKHTGMTSGEYRRSSGKTTAVA